MVLPSTAFPPPSAGASRSSTDRVYRLASERLIKVRSAQQVKAAEQDDSPDFSSEEPVVHFEAPPPFVFDADKAAARVRTLSAGFGKQPAILSSAVSLTVQRQVRYFVSTEGTRLEHGRGYARIMTAARAKAADGSDFMLTEEFDAEDFAGLPADAAVAQAIDRISADISATLRAPSAEPYAGPAILSGQAAAVLFHEIFGHRVEGHRQKDEADGQTFTKSINSRVLPEFLSVTFDPARRRAGDVTLNGWYAFDDEGLKARPVKVVENGVLKAFLMSRSPVRGFPESNGHGRRAPGYEVVARQSNLIVESAKQVPDAELRAMLIAEARRQGKPYGLFFRDVTGGFTTTAREGLQAFKVMPVVLYRVWTDGRPDELIRGADIVGTPLASFGKILATSGRTEVFNGFCGAESGSVPVSAVSPALLVSEIEIQMKPRSQDRPPLLPPPSVSGGLQPAAGLCAFCSTPSVVGQDAATVGQALALWGRPPSLWGRPSAPRGRTRPLWGRPPPLWGRPPPLWGRPPALWGRPPPLWGRPPACGGLPGRPALNQTYRPRAGESALPLEFGHF